MDTPKFHNTTKLSYSLSRTLNLHGSEFVKIEVSMERECPDTPDDAHQTFKEMQKFVKDKIVQSEIEWKVGS